jgi:hypothetical protein
VSEIIRRSETHLSMNNGSGVGGAVRVPISMQNSLSASKCQQEFFISRPLEQVQMLARRAARACAISLVHQERDRILCLAKPRFGSGQLPLYMEMIFEVVSYTVTRVTIMAALDSAGPLQLGKLNNQLKNLQVKIEHLSCTK